MTLEPKRRIPHAAIYARVSTPGQAEDGLSLEAQPVLCLQKLEELFGVNGFTYEVFQDAGKSAKTGPSPEATESKRSDRPGLWQLILGVREKRFDVLVAFRGDRIYRKTSWALALYPELLLPNGCDLEYVAERFDKSIGGQLSAGVLAQVAEYQRVQTGENIRYVVRQRRNAGYFQGSMPFGWRKATADEVGLDRPNILPVPEQREVVLRAKELFLEGGSTVSVAKKFNTEKVPCQHKEAAWNSTSVAQMLTNPVHAGFVRKDTDGSLVEGLHKEHRFWDVETLRQITERLERNRRRFKGISYTQPFRLFAGLLKCDRCGANLYSHYSTSSPGYRCQGRVQTEDGAHVHVNADYLEHKTVEVLTRLACELPVLEAADREVERLVRSRDVELAKEAAALLARLATLEKRAKVVMDAVESGTYTQERARARFAELDKEEHEVRVKLMRLEAERDAAEERASAVKRARMRLRDFPALWKTMTDVQKRECIHSVLEKVVVGYDCDQKWARFEFATGHDPVTVHLVRGADRFKRNRGDGPGSLTPRELAALRHVLDGYDYNEVAARMGITPQGAHVTLRNATSKLGAKSFGEAAESIREMLLLGQDGLPLLGRAKGPRYEARPLTPTEYILVKAVAGGASVKQAATAFNLTAQRADQLVESALRKAGARGAKDAMRKLDKDWSLLPYAERNRRKGAEG